MSASNQTLESRLFQGYWDDGLLDLLAGGGVVGVAALWALDLVGLGAVVPAMLAAFWPPLRRTLVEPRIGLVEFSDARTDRMRGLGLAGVGLGVALLVIFAGAAAAGRVFLSDLAPAIPALLLAVMAAVTGLGLGLPRFLGYAAVLSASGFAIAALQARPEAAMFAGGVAILATGARRVRRFLRLPVQRDEDI